MAILSLESQSPQTLLVGENLGTFRPKFTGRWGRHGLLQTYGPPFAQVPIHASPGTRRILRGILDTTTHHLRRRWLCDDLELRARLKNSSRNRFVLLPKLRKAPPERQRLNEALLEFSISITRDSA